MAPDVDVIMVKEYSGVIIYQKISLSLEPVLQMKIFVEFYNLESEQVNMAMLLS